MRYVDNNNTRVYTNARREHTSATYTTVTLKIFRIEHKRDANEISTVRKRDVTNRIERKREGSDAAAAANDVHV